MKLRAHATPITGSRGYWCVEYLTPEGKRAAVLSYKEPRSVAMLRSREAIDYEQRLPEVDAAELPKPIAGRLVIREPETPAEAALAVEHLLLAIAVDSVYAAREQALMWIRVGEYVLKEAWRRPEQSEDEEEELREQQELLKRLEKAPLTEQPPRQDLGSEAW